MDPYTLDIHQQLQGVSAKYLGTSKYIRTYLSRHASGRESEMQQTKAHHAATYLGLLVGRKVPGFHDIHGMDFLVDNSIGALEPWLLGAGTRT